MTWRQGLPYGQDLRDRVLAARDEGQSVRAVAELKCRPRSRHVLWRHPNHLLSQAIIRSRSRRRVR